ncbi:DUF3472 domain-containing protein [Roseimaritima ulvae]|uniref:DUF5077 domain-containing protein n=1 Tax=Roseimaritima ulvae TaxID=980254 RepID=A0A5B9QVW1_9BACT|nr:DUF3472 domain-containing protein [Roseimaritima ulvae]QEG42039.1 hypothetical protein UC8_40690 [Roseimaritima ulvae]
MLAKKSLLVCCSITLVAACSLFGGTQAEGAQWLVPTGGNAFPTDPDAAGGGVGRRGTVSLATPKDALSVYFHTDRAANLSLSVRARAKRGGGKLNVEVGSQSWQVEIEGKAFADEPVGTVSVAQAGYVRVNLSGGEANTGGVEVSDIVVSSDTTDLTLTYVKNNDGNMFYWGRRGPSVHLRYDVPKDRPLRYAYTEITVPSGQDVQGSYYMANGFGQGYFGFQVNGPQERRVLFSVWSPFKTDNPREIPEDKRIVALGRGPDVHIGEFGNEGSGGQSYLIYPWKAGRTYRFLTEVRPDGEGRTIYTSWFGDKADDTWRLIASFRRPETDTHLTGFHSFLENFSPTYGAETRQAEYGNVWVRDVDEQWHECTRARFSVDATGGGGHRLDFIGGAEGDHFFMRNCGFFNETGKPGQSFTRQSTASDQPQIEFDALPRG